MRFIALAVGLILFSSVAGALEIEDRRRFGEVDATQELRVISTADISVFTPVIMDFIKQNPSVALDYVVASSAEVMTALETGKQAFDVAISSAMDLQTKLANDGFARPHRSPITAEIPEWARWRDHLFAFTREPAVMVLSRSAFEGLELPKTRQALMALLRQHPERFRGRIGTYDVRSSGLGYLFATQDARTSETFWQLTEIMGYLGARLYCCSSDMIDDVAGGKLAIAYNVLGSYAGARVDIDKLQIVYPDDFTTVMLRTALIPDTSENPDMAGRFLDHLLSIAWHGAPLDGYAFERLTLKTTEDSGNLRRIGLGPGLLVYLDRFKKRSFLTAWENAMLQK